MATLQQLLAPQVILESVTTRIKQPGDVLQKFMGMGLAGGPAVLDNTSYMRYCNYDIFDSIQDVATFRGPGTGPSVAPRNPVSMVPVTLPRVHMKMPLMYEELGNLRPLGKTSGNIDQGGRDYITRQETILKMYFQNAREFAVAGMMNGSFGFTISGDDWAPALTSPTITISMQVPSGNTNQLNMLGAGNIIAISWDQVASAQVFENILAINAAFWQLHGWPLKHIWINSVMWGYITNNSGIKARSGTANVSFEEFSKVPGYDNPDRAMDESKGRLRCLPDYTFHIYDGGAKLGGTPNGGTFTQWFGNKQACFIPEPSPTIFQLIIGGEYVVEQEGMAATIKRGLNFWPRYITEPSRIELVGVDNYCPVVRVPKALVPAQPVFP